MGNPKQQYGYQHCGFMFVDKKRFLCEIPRSHVKHTNIVEASNFVLQRGVCYGQTISCVVLPEASRRAPWNWCHTGGRMKIMLEARWRSSTSMNKPYHITHYLHLMLLCDSYLC
jgi:hypothetical protein